MIIIGAGGFGTEVFCWATQSNMDVSAFLDEMGEVAMLMGVPVLNSYKGLQGHEFIVAIGDPIVRKEVYERAIGNGLMPSKSIVHPTAIIGGNVQIDLGSIVCPNVVLTTDILIKKGCIINISATVGHGCTLGDFVTISPGANISGNVTLNDGVYVGTNAAIREGVNVKTNTVIGMGAVLLRDTEHSQILVGNPARPKVIRSV